MKNTMIKPIPLFKNFLEQNKTIERLYLLIRDEDTKYITKFLEENMDLITPYAPSDYLLLIVDAIKRNDYSNVINRLNQFINSEYFFYIGPINYFEKGNEKLDLLLLNRETSAELLVNKIEGYTKELEEQLGIPCTFAERHVEFYNLLLGPNSGNEIAIFSPFFFKNYDIKKVEGKRSIIFINILMERFRNLTLPLVKDHIRFNSEYSILLDAHEDEIRKAFIIWITLHEMFHSSGPIPLFDRNVSKLNLGLDYAGIEELRVDTTAWVSIDLLPFITPRDKRIVRELILCERLLRSARRGYWKNNESGILKNSSDNQQGAFWFSILHEEKGLELDQGQNQIRINHHKVDGILKSFLNNYYNGEAKINNEAQLLQLSETIFKKYLGVNHRRNAKFSSTLRLFLNSLENYDTHIKFL
jgi:hypothetical protein